MTAIRYGHWCKQCANMAMIGNPKLKARMRYVNAGARGEESDWGA